MLNEEELVLQAAQDGFIYIPDAGKFVSPPLQAAVLKFGASRVKQALTTERIKAMINSTRANYRNIRRICDTTQDPSYCYMAEAILPQLERLLEEFEQGINTAKPLQIYGVDESNKAGEVILDIYRPSDY